MSWIAEYDTQGREFPTCVHVTKTTGTMTHGATYVPIEDGKAVRAENAELRELVRDMWRFTGAACKKYPRLFDPVEPGGQMVRLNPIDAFEQRMRELGVEQ